MTASVDGQTVTAKGPKGELKFVVNDEVLVKHGRRRDRGRPARPDQGRTLQVGHVAHHDRQHPVKGVKDGFEKQARNQRRRLSRRHAGQEPAARARLHHDVIYETPEGITIAVPKPTEIVITGIDKQKVGQVAAEIREYRGPEPYKGKGVKYAGETIVRKEGKKK